MERVLLIVNSAAGLGHADLSSAALADRLQAALGASYQVERYVGRDHAEVSAAARSFVQSATGRVNLIVGGGSGTARAVIEGVFAATGGVAPGPERLRLAFLRMGSGNILARQFGVLQDAAESLDGIAANLLRGRIAPCTVVRCETRDRRGEPRVLYGASLIGLGILGRVPADLERWRARHPRLRRLLARWLGTERANHLDYLRAFVRRLMWSRRRGRTDELALEGPDGRVELSLLAGALLNFPVAELPLESQVRVEEPALQLALLPRLSLWQLLCGLLRPATLTARARQLRLELGQRLRLTLRGARRVMPFFVDEDPELARQELCLAVAGALCVVPGPAYAGPGRRTP